MKISVVAIYDGMTPAEVEHYISETFRCGHIVLKEDQIDAFKRGDEVEMTIRDPHSDIRVKLTYQLEGF